MPLKLSEITKAEAGAVPSGSWIPVAIPTGPTTFTLRGANPNQIGATGPQGPAGSVILSGAGAPSSSLGKDTDYFINVTSGDLYYKVSGAWSVVGNIKGPTGAAGAPGADGADGAAGPAGPAGAPGADAVPAGAVGNVQYNDGAGALAAEAAFTYNSTDNELQVDGNVRVGVETLTYGANTTLDFLGSAIQLLTVTGAIVFDGTNYAAGRQITVVLTDDGSARAVSFDANWTFLNTKPTNLTASKKSVLTLTSTTAAATGVIAAWAEDPN